MADAVVTFRDRGRVRAVGLPGLVLLGGLCCLLPAGTGQTAGVNQGGPGYLHAQAGSTPAAPQGSSQGAAQIDRMRQAEQRKHIAADTVKLVELSNQLKAEVDAAPKDQLSVDVLRKAAEIEKTAHDLKGWMNY